MDGPLRRRKRNIRLQETYLLSNFVVTISFDPSDDFDPLDEAMIDGGMDDCRYLAAAGRYGSSELWSDDPPDELPKTIFNGSHCHKFENVFPFKT